MPLTAEQIAEKLGISNATVSRVLNNNPRVSSEARDAVLDLVRQTGGMPRLLGPRSRRLASRQAAQPALVRVLHVVRFPIIPISDSPEVSLQQLPQSEFFSPPARLATSFGRHVMDGIINELHQFKMRAVVQVVESLRSRQLLAEVNNRENTGTFLLGGYDDDVPEFLDKCRSPVVSFMSWDRNGWPDYVGIDNYKGIRLGFEHLRRLGHTRIGYVAGELRYSFVFRERFAAYKMLLADADTAYRPDWVCEGSCNIQPIQDAAEAMLRSHDRPTAILCCFDGAALAVKRAADKLGLRIPADLSVVGFDDAEIAQLFTPPLTTIHVPTLLMGAQAVQLMVMRQQRPIQPGEGCSLRVTPSLVQRQSTAAPPRGTGSHS